MTESGSDGRAGSGGTSGPSGGGDGPENAFLGRREPRFAVCPVCKATFRLRRDWQRWCSSACRKEGFDRRRGKGDHVSNYPKRRAPAEPGPLFENRPPAQAHSATSIAAAEEIRPSAATLRDRVLAVIRESGIVGVTDEEIVEGTGINPSTVRPRRVELVEAGLVRDSNLTRPTASGRLATIWIATPGEVRR